VIDRVVFDPRPTQHVRPAARASRLNTLDGAVIVVIDNGKPHATTLLELVIEDLRRQWSIDGVVHLGPPSPGHGGDPADAEVAAEWATAAIAAVGDCGSCSSGTVMDAVIFERLGIPAVPIVTHPFVPTATATAAAHGFEDYALAVVDHPITSLDHVALTRRATAAAPQVVTALLRGPADRPHPHAVHSGS
jgi:hypothetical protein